MIQIFLKNKIYLYLLLVKFTEMCLQMEGKNLKSKETFEKLLFKWKSWNNSLIEKT